MISFFTSYGELLVLSLQ